MAVKMEMYFEPEEEADVVDYSIEHLNQIRSMINDSNKAVEEIDCNLQFLNDHKEVVEHNLTSMDPTASYIPLHHSKHRDFIDSVTFMADLCNNSEKYKAIRDANSPSKVMKTLDAESVTYSANLDKLKELDREFDKLKSLHNEILNNIIKPSSSLSM